MVDKLQKRRARLASEMMQAHTVADLVVDAGMQMTAIRLEDGRRLFGITNARMQLSPDNLTVRLVLEVQGPYTINGRPAAEVFKEAQEAAEKAKADAKANARRIHYPTRPLQGPKGEVIGTITDD